MNTCVPQKYGISGDCRLFVILFAETISKQEDIRTTTQKFIVDSELRRKLAKLLFTVQTKYVNEYVPVLELDQMRI